MRYLALLSFILLFIAKNGTSQTWQSINGPLESNIQDIIIKNDTIYVSSMESGGLFKKHKNDKNWVFSNISSNGELLYGLNSIEIGSNGFYYAGGPGLNFDGEYFNHFYVSDDFGKSWNPFRNGIEFFSGPALGVTEIIISRNGSIIVGFGNGIFKYSGQDEAFKLSSENDKLPLNSVSAFYEYEDTLLAGRMNGLEFSLDDGDSWTASKFDSVSVLSIGNLDNKLFLGTNNGLYYAKSINNSFEVIDDLLEVPVYSIHEYQEWLLVGTPSKLVLINPEDNSVQYLFEGVNFAPINAINSIDDTILLGTESGVLECDLLNEKCNLVGVANSRVRDLSIFKTDALFAGTIQSIYRYSIQSERWDSTSISFGSSKSILPFSKDSLYAIANDLFVQCSFQNSVCDSTQVDNGNLLVNLNTNSTGDLFVISSNSVFQSSDKGKKWDSIFDFETGKRNFESPIFAFSDSLLFFDAAEQGLVKYFLNTGEHAIIGFEETGINDYHLTSEGIIYVSAFSSIHKSTDFGESWKTLLGPQDLIGRDLLIDVLYDEDSEKLYAIALEGRVYVSKDEGKSWGINEGMLLIHIRDAIITSDGKLYLGTSNAGVFVNTKPLNPPITISSEYETEVIPKSFILHQNYPNPFNPSTAISFELNQARSVSLDVFNIFGQRIITKSLGKLNSGTHSESVNLSSYSSGVYFLKVSTGNESQTIKMTLIK